MWGDGGGASWLGTHLIELAVSVLLQSTLEAKEIQGCPSISFANGARSERCRKLKVGETAVSFLDNLENNLKAMEGREERDGQEHVKREQARTAAVAVGPWAAQLRESQYAQKLLGLAARAGMQRRTKIFPAWLDTTLRLEWEGERLELQPTNTGIQAASVTKEYEEMWREPVDLSGDPAPLLEKWLQSVEARQPVLPVEPVAE